MMKEEIKIDGKKCTIITNDWLKEFPSYKKHKTRIWKKLVGPLSFSMGYEVKYGTDYKIGCSVFNLSNPLEFMCANLSAKPLGRRSLITWAQHEKGLYREAVEELREAASLPLKGPVTLSQVEEAYKNYKGGIYSSRHFEDPALICAWAGQEERAKKRLEWGLEAFKNENVHNPYGSYEKWYEMMLEKISNPEALQQIVKEQIHLHKLEKLPYQELIID